MKARLEELFHEVADLPRDARLRYLSDQNVDTQTRKDLETLLEFDSESSISLHRDLSQLAEQTAAGLGTKDLRCGPYKMGTLLGQGGMGTVHLAERVDGEVTQHAAIKLLRPGVDDPASRQRFRSERQILATLSHPNVARLLDAGHREDGQPYLVMEYVEGKPIDVHTADLTIRGKIALFLKVCGAVGYLHRNLVVHRDLKPSNILVTEDGEPKLLDFGIAKMLDLTMDSTVTSARMLTPDYASPEQVSGSPVSTATDIYSLGAVLYKLLTGASPHQFENPSMEAIVSAVSTGRIIAPSRLTPGLKGDLEMILLKALRTEPQERYATVEQLADDLECYLELRPIRARKGDVWYRSRKFVRRYWMPLSAMVTAMGCLAIGLGIANHERAVAQQRFKEVRRLSAKLFDIDTEVSKVSGTTKARQLIVDTSVDYLRRLTADVHIDNELGLEIGHAYMRMARVQGVPLSNNLGQVEQASQNLKIAEQFIHSVLVSEPANRMALLRGAQVAHDRMLLARTDSSVNEEVRLGFARQAAGYLERFAARKGDEADSTALLTVYLNVADQYMLERQYDEALRLCRRATEAAEVLKRPAYVGTFHWVSAEVDRNRGKLDEALTEIRESVRILKPAPGTAENGRVMNHALALIKEGRLLGDSNTINMERPKEALAPLRECFDVVDRVAHKDSSDQNPRGLLATAGIAIGGILRDSDPRASLEMYDHTLQHIGEIKNNPSFRRFEVSALAGSSYALRNLGRTADARKRIDAAFDRLRLINEYPARKIETGSEISRAYRALADYYAGTGDVVQATQTYREALDLTLKADLKPDSNLRDAVEMSRLWGALAGLHQQGFDLKRLQLWRHWDSQLPHNSFVIRQLEAAKSASNYAGLSQRPF